MLGEVDMVVVVVGEGVDPSMSDKKKKKRYLYLGGRIQIVISVGKKQDILAGRRSWWERDVLVGR